MDSKNIGKNVWKDFLRVVVARTDEIDFHFIGTIGQTSTDFLHK